jgi:hypothetical protein
MIEPAATPSRTSGRARGLLLLVAALATATVVAGSRPASADGAGDQIKAQNERCANRISIALTGKTASADQLSASDPKAAIDTLLKSADFQERFARFINQQFNNAPGATATPGEDASYWIAKTVIGKGTPWSDMFLGKYDIREYASNIAVVDDDNGLGYFRAYDWYTRYAGNEPNGVRIATAYRILNNVVGLKLTASTGSPNIDQTAKGRQAKPCSDCHFDGWFALDKVAAVLPLNTQQWNQYSGGPKAMLGDKMIGSDKELVQALVDSENFAVNACRLSFKYLYAREDNQCEGPLLDRCVDTFKSEKTIQSALSMIAHDASYCE